MREHALIAGILEPTSTAGTRTGGSDSSARAAQKPTMLLPALISRGRRRCTFGHLHRLPRLTRLYLDYPALGYPPVSHDDLALASPLPSPSRGERQSPAFRHNRSRRDVLLGELQGHEGLVWRRSSSPRARWCAHARPFLQPEARRRRGR